VLDSSHSLFTILFPYVVKNLPTKRRAGRIGIDDTRSKAQ
jgi:hypothetical protein